MGDDVQNGEVQDEGAVQQHGVRGEGAEVRDEGAVQQHEVRGEEAADD